MLRNTLILNSNLGRTEIRRRGLLTGTLSLLSCLHHASSASLLSLCAGFQNHFFLIWSIQIGLICNFGSVFPNCLDHRMYLLTYLLTPWLWPSESLGLRNYGCHFFPVDCFLSLSFNLHPPWILLNIFSCLDLGHPLLLLPSQS